MSLSPPRPDDAAALAEMAAASFTSTFAHLYPPEQLAAHLTQWMPVEKCAAQIADPAWPIMLWRDAAGIAGYAKLGIVDFPLPDGYGDASDTIELHHLYMLDRAKGSGAAQSLMNWAIDYARSAGYHRLVLSVFIENLRAQAFYRRNGFVEIGKNPYQVGDIIDDDRIWMRTLG
jgi:diamine N-acetyltransferase